MKKLDIAASVLLFIGAFNWGILGIFGVNLIDFFLENEIGDRFVYATVGFAGIYKMVYWRSIRHRWKED